MGTTTNKYPYPETTELINQGAVKIKALATAVDSQLRTTAMGVASIVISNATVGAVNITFPAGRFASAPAVCATSEIYYYYLATYQRTATAARIYARENMATARTITFDVDWIASTIG